VTARLGTGISKSFFYGVLYLNPDPYKSGKHDRDQIHSKKRDPGPHESDADPQPYTILYNAHPSGSTMFFGQDGTFHRSVGQVGMATLVNLQP
jgi:hypothetical protein